MFYKLYSLIAQSVEHAAVNRSVVGSSPTQGVFILVILLQLIYNLQMYGDIAKR